VEVKAVATSQTSEPKSGGSGLVMGIAVLVSAGAAAYAYNQVEKGEPVIPADFEMPKFDIPDFELPSIELPSIELPASLESLGELFFGKSSAPAPSTTGERASASHPQKEAPADLPDKPAKPSPSAPSVPPAKPLLREVKEPMKASVSAPSSGELVEKALASGVLESQEETGQAVFQAVEKMARLDAQAFDSVLKQTQNQHQAEVATLQDKLQAASMLTDNLTSAFEAKVGQMKAEEEAAAAAAEASRLAALEEQKAAMQAEAQAQANKERQDRLSQIDTLRSQVNALGVALDSRGWEQERHHSAHMVAVSTFALEAALAQGAPFTAQLGALLQAAPGEPLLHAAARALPPHLAEKGAPTLTQLFDGFEEVKQVVRSQALLPVSEGEAGPLSGAVSTLAGWLRVEEEAGVPVLGASPSQPQGVEAVLAATRTHLKAGQLMQAAAVLDEAAQGTAFAHPVQKWASGVRDRVMVEQTIKLLQAHATAINASVS